MKKFFFKKYIAFFLSVVVILCLGVYVAKEVKLPKFEVSNFQLLTEYINEVEDEIADSIGKVPKLNDIYGILLRALMKSETQNYTVYKYDNVIYHNDVYKTDLVEINSIAKKLRRLNEYVESMGKEMLFVLSPYKVMNGINEVEKYLPIYDTNEISDELLTRLYQNDVPFIDLRKSLRESNEEFDNLFFKTEHTITPYAGLLTAKAIASNIKSQKLYSPIYTMESFYKNKFEEMTIKDIIFETVGGKMGVYYMPREDLNLIIPSAKTSYTHSHEGILSEGKFEEIILPISPIESYNNGRKILHKELYFQRGSEDVIFNNNNVDAPTALIIEDDFFIPTSSYLTTEFSKVEFISASTKNDIQTLVESKIAEYDYLIVGIGAININVDFFDFLNY